MMFLCFGTLSIKAQKTESQSLLNSFPKEYVALVSSTSVILSGQMLGYDTKCYSDDNIGALSSIVYVELVSDTKTVVFKHKLRLENGKAYGDFFVPTTLKTGHYKLIAYTQWSLNNSENAFDQKDVYVINPYLNAHENNLKSTFSDNEKYIEISLSHDLEFRVKNEDNGLKISTDINIYKQRSKVKLELQNTLNNVNFGDYSILVKKIDSVNIQNYNLVKTTTDNKTISWHLPEMRGELIQGTVVDLKTNLPQANQVVSFSIPGVDYVYKSTISNEKGEFYFNLFEHYNQQKAYIQVVSEKRDDFKIIIKQKAFDYYNDLQFYPLKLNTNLKQFITENSIYNQVESAYFNLKKDSIVSISPAKSFYGDPDIVYVLDDFTRFPSVKETFIEVVQNAAIRSKSGGYQFMVYDSDDPFESQYKDVKPLLIMDGIEIQNESIVVDYNPNEIESISLKKGVYSFGSVIYNGIIDIKLKKQNVLNLSGTYIEQMEIEMPIAEKRYFKQDFQKDQKRIPDLRTQLLWLPDFELNSHTQTLEFYTSDISGHYLIELNGVATNGKSVYLSLLFEVIKE